VIADQPDAPPYFSYDAVLNTRERPTLEQALGRELRPLTLEDALALERDGAQLLDSRDPDEFQDAHLAGSINVGLDGTFETWCGTVLEPERPIVLLAEPGREEEGVTRLGRIGFDNVAGYVTVGLGALEDAGDELVGRIERVTPAALAQQLGRSDPPELIDVRTAAEFEESRIDGAINVPLAELPARVGSLARDRPVVVYCQAGYRSAIAASLLRRAGLTEVIKLVGGLAAWTAADHGAVSV
jgi:hydroxyacylglutathione hydrolase